MPIHADTSPNIKWPLPAVSKAKKKTSFLSESAFKEVQQSMESEPWGPTGETRYHTISGRWVMEPSLSADTKSEITRACVEAFGKDDLKLLFMFGARYQQLGKTIPYLWEHMDQNACQYTMDLCVKMNQLDDWGVIVDDELFSEEENSAILFHGQQQTHSRPPYPVDNPEAYIHVMFALFVTPDHWAYNVDFDDHEASMEMIKQYKMDGDIRYYEYRGHAPRFDGLPAENAVCEDCMECDVVPEGFTETIEGYIDLSSSM